MALALAWLLNGLAMGYEALSPLGLCFPLIIAALVPVRRYLLARLFNVEEQKLLDSVESPAEPNKEATNVFESPIA